MNDQELQQGGEQQEQAHDRDRKIRVSVRILGTDKKPFHFEFEPEAPLLEVLERGLLESGEELVPPPHPPVDTLHDLHHGEKGPAIEELNQPLWEYLRRPHSSSEFGIELARAIRVNTKWMVAPAAEMTPRQILELFGLDYQQYTLYRPGSSDPLPIDTAVAVFRREAFEAQRDGKYGA